MPDVYVDEGRVEAQIPLDGNVRAVRIDPADRSCIVKILELSLNDRAVPLKKHVETNGRAVKGGYYIFDTTDPNINVKLQGLDRHGEDMISLKMELVHVPEDMAGDIIGEIRKIF